MLHVPSGEQKVREFALDLIEKCRVSQGQRAAYYRVMNAISETGRYDGTKSLINMMYKHLDRAAAHLFSPIELKFGLDFDHIYPKVFHERGNVVARQVTRHWSRASVDKLFARGVFDALKYGSSILKQWSQVNGPDLKPSFHAQLVMPWQFGVYNESLTELDMQAAMCETTMLTLPEIWRRIYYLPEAEKLYRRIFTHAMQGQRVSEPQSFFHQVLSTSQLQTGVTGATRPLPGGIVQLNNDPNYSIMGPQVGVDTAEVHELWVLDDEDYTTIELIEPDILVAPRHQKHNALGVTGHHPYTLIQANETSCYLWGRSELVDLIEPQMLLSSFADDAKRLTGLQVDKLLGFIGENALTDEMYAQFRSAGWMNLSPNSKVEDLTPEFPASLLEMIKFIIEQINTLGSFPAILQGQGDQGVRAQGHAETLMKTASPTLRDRALIVERQCAEAGHLTLALKEAKDATRYSTNADTPEEVEKTSFMLTDLPSDWQIIVDSHSSSPIFASENSQKIAYAHKAGIVDGEYVIDHLDLPNAEEAKIKFRERQKSQQQMVQNLLRMDPQVGEKLLLKQMGGGGGKK
jgi:hypothetical protein